MRLNRNLFVVVIFFFLVFLLISQIGISIALSRSKPRILKYLTENYKHTFQLQGISFNFLHGLRIREAAVFYGTQSKNTAPSPSVYIKSASASIKLLPLIFKRTLAVQIKIDAGEFLMSKEDPGINLQIIFSDICKKTTLTKPRILNIFKDRLGISIKTAKLAYAEGASLEKDMYILIKDSRFRLDQGRIKFDGDLEFNCILPDEAYISRYFNNRHLKQQVRCSVVGNVIGEDAAMDLIIIEVGEDQIIGAGVTKGYAQRNPLLDISFMHFTLSLENIAPLKENFNAQGNLFCSLELKGLMDKIKPNVASSLYYCNFSYTPSETESHDIKNLRGELEYRNNQLRLHKVSLDLNAVPLNAELLAQASNDFRINLRLSLPQDFLDSQKLPLDKLEAVFDGRIKSTLQGDLSIDTLYLRKDSNIKMQALLKNVEYDFRNRDEKYLEADTIELVKDNMGKIQQLKFRDFSSKVYTGRDKIEINDLDFSGYAAKFNGSIKLNTKNDASLTAVLQGLGLDAREVMQDINVSDKLLSGTMDAEVAFDNQQEKFIVGDCRITDGIARLDLVADILRLPSLNKVDFDVMDTSFSISKDTVSMSQVKLKNPQIQLDSRWTSNGKIEGVLSLKAAAELLNESKAFRRLLRLTENEKQYIDFDFLLGGIPKTVRAMWMKGEFKDKIVEGLSAWTKRRIERELDHLVGELSRE